MLKDYWPPFLQELAEFIQISEAEQPELDKLVQDVQNAPEDFFLVSLSEDGCKRWEPILGLRVASDEELEARREKIMIKYLGHLPYTDTALKEYLSTVSTDFAVNIDNDAYKLFVRVTLNGYAQRATLETVLGQMIPANLVLFIQVVIPQTVQRVPLVVGAAMVTMVKHTHKPQGGA